MKLFIKKIVTQILIFLCVLTFADYFVSNALKKSDDFAYGDCFIWDELLNGKIKEDVLIYGSSRAWVHFDPNIIQDSLGLTAYNLGIDGHNFWLQHLRHKKVVQNNQKPKMIILSLGAGALAKRKDLYNKNQFLPYIFDDDIREYTRSYNGFSNLDYVLPMYRYFGNVSIVKKQILADWSKTSQEKYRIKGFKAIDREWSNDLKKAKSKRNSIFMNIDKKTLNLLKDFLAESKELGIYVVMVYSPEYIDGQNFIANREDIINEFKRIALEYQIQFIDYSTDEICTDKKYFYNSLHLNAKGSEIFTNKLVEDFKRIDAIDEIIKKKLITN
ncbi:MAG: hypothetical protein ACJAVA_001694 [Flavobacteriaceae bacterium]|jgi:hypothetical protein